MTIGSKDHVPIGYKVAIETHLISIIMLINDEPEIALPKSRMSMTV